MRDWKGYEMNNGKRRRAVEAVRRALYTGVVAVDRMPPIYRCGNKLCRCGRRISANKKTCLECS
jgi:hypothetical protein